MSDFDEAPDVEYLIGKPFEGEDIAVPIPYDKIHLTDVVNWYRNGDPSVRRHTIRRMIAADPVSAVEELMPTDNWQVRNLVNDGLRRHRAKEQIERLLRPAGADERPRPISLTDFLAEPDEDVRYRVDGLWPREGRIVLSAQNKSGKTTLTGNLVRSLVDGDDFLGQFGVERADRVVLIDNEMSPSQIRRWLRDQGIRKTDNVDVVSLRGRVSSFNILDASIRAEWAELIGEADVLIFDCLRPALDALGLSEDKESGRFLEALDELIHVAGIPELVLVHHMGHSNERSRGDSRLEDWPDAKWSLLKSADTDEGQPMEVFFKAFGRDVDQSEVRLAYDSDTRHLTVNGGSRRAATSGRIENGVQVFVADHPGCSQGQIEKAVQGDNMTIRNAIRSLTDEGRLRVEKQAPGKATLHFPTTPSDDFSEPG